ncbi:MAG: DnaJ domain-containing protein [Phycisphaerales bacterium]|nr:DnaJ domain-containing protein [Phycisphaerales bacterium]
MGERSARPGSVATHYEVLGVPLDAGPDRIRAAYRELARKLHPDVNREAMAHTMFVRVQAAYDVLCDAMRRAAYDRVLNAAATPPRPGAHYTWTNIANDATPRGGRRGGTDFDEMYDAFFGGGERP